MRLIVLAALALVLALSAVPAAAAAPTKAEFIKRGDALCAQTARQLAPLRRRAEAAKLLPAREQWAAVTAIWTEQIRIQVRFNRQLRAIGLPANDAAARALLAGLDRGVVLARRVRDAFADRRVKTLAAALPAYLRFTLDLNRRTAAYGFRVCGRA